jgi:hypothetical protein
MEVPGQGSTQGTRIQLPANRVTVHQTSARQARTPVHKAKPPARTPSGTPALASGSASTPNQHRREPQS